MAATGGGYLLSALRSDVGMRLLVGGAGVLALHWPAFKIITEKVTQENLQKVLNPEFIESVHKEVAAHGLHSPQAVKEYIMQNKGSVAQQIATQTGFSQESVQETLSSLLSAMGSQAA
jgi:pantoate kinase